ncbi:MAG TPA: (d)CMP kinase [Candidatus Pullichristensenella stercoripullorum]|nr:(d)CMP kinase [Candidatus Pullichristensenella stercoripullorum]
MSVFSIAIDGPSGAGKSSVARAVAEKLGAMYLDTGAMYRAVGLYMLKNGVPLDDPAAIAAHCPGVDVRVGYGKDGRQCVYLGEEDVSEAIRAAEVSLAASSVSTVPEVRERMVALQRRIASGHSVVMDGRDIGTKVLPDATLKVFLTASAEVRARRRFHELAQKGMPEPYEKVLEELVRRDDVDTHRAASPLRMAEDAVEVDCSQMTLDEVVEAVAALARQALEAKA